MSRTLQRGPHFTSDVQSHFGWYWDEAGEEVAWRFEAALEQTLRKICVQPGLGRERFFRAPGLKGLRSFRVEPPFDKLLLFYRWQGDLVEVWRIMHGARDLPRRLTPPSGSDPH